MEAEECHREHPEVWRPLTGMPDGAELWGSSEYEELAGEWRGIEGKLKGLDAPSEFLQGWLKERAREFSIETGQIEGLYTLRRGVTEQFITEGFQGANASHSLEGVASDTLRGLLEDQEDALGMVFEDVASGRPLSAYAIRSWHQLLTRHQETVVGLTPAGEHVQVPFERKGVWKIQPNNPKRADGVVHQYCPPERVADEMDRLFDLYEGIRRQEYPVAVESAWLHHRFVRTHPFQDGNGRVSRLLMAYAYLKRGLPTPVVLAAGRGDYIRALEGADRGDLRAFADHVGDLARTSVRGCVAIGKQAVAGELERPHCNGGRTKDGTYYPPKPDAGDGLGR